MNLLKPLISLALVVASSLAQAENGVSDKEILIGQFAAMSGPAAQLGQRMQQGMLAYFHLVNEQGGVNGRTIRLKTRDDGYEPNKTVVAVKALIQQDKVFALAGSVGTPTALAALALLNEAQVPLVGLFTGAQALREPFNRQVFHVRASYADEAERIVQHLTTLGIKKIAVLYQNDTFGKTGLDGVVRALSKRQLKPVATGTVERNSIDVAKSLETILKSEPEAVVQISVYKSSASFIKQARVKGYGGPFFNLSGVGTKALADELGDAGQGVVISQVVPFPYAGNNTLVRDYQQRMLDMGQKEFDFTSMEGYLTARVLTEGLRRAGRNLTREALITALESMHDVNLGGFTVNYSAKDHQGSTFTDLAILGRGGKFMH